MIPVTVYLQTPEAADAYRQLFQQQFYTVPTIGSTVRVFVSDRADVYVVREVYHDFRSGPQGVLPLPVSVVVSSLEVDASPEAEARTQSEIDIAWGTPFQERTPSPESPRLG